MIDLVERLAELADSQPVSGVDAAMVGVRHHRSRRHRRRSAVVGAVGVGLVVVTAVLVWPTGDDQGQRVTTGPTVPDAPSSGWHQLDAGPLADRPNYGSVWAENQLVAFGVGGVPGVSETPDLQHVYSYDPDAAEWTHLPPGPDGVIFPATPVWTGDEVILVGRDDATRAVGGAAWNPGTNTWRRLPTADGRITNPDANDLPAVWTGTEVVLPLVGLAYAPDDDTWREVTTPPVAFTQSSLEWTGDEIVVVGRTEPFDVLAGDAVAVAYDPAEDSWRDLPETYLNGQATDTAWSGEELIAVNLDVRVATLAPDDIGWTASGPILLPTSDCSPSVAVLDDVAVVASCTGLAIRELEVGDDGTVWWTSPENPAEGYPLVAAGDRILTFGPGSSDGPLTTFHEYVPPVGADGTITPPDRVLIGDEELSVPDRARVTLRAREEILDGLGYELRLGVDVAGEQCVVRWTYVGTGVEALLGGYREYPGAEPVTVSATVGGADRPAVLLPPGARLPDDDFPHVVFEPPEPDPGSITDVSCPTEAATLDLARSLRPSSRQ